MVIKKTYKSIDINALLYYKNKTLQILTGKRALII